MSRRHKIAGRKFNRNASARSALLRSLACALIREESIKTTLAKAKSLRQVVEPLITQAELNSLVVQRRLFDALRDKQLVHKLVTVLGPRFKARAGGYCRIVKCGFRPGDDAPMAIIQFVE